MVGAVAAAGDSKLARHSRAALAGHRPSPYVWDMTLLQPQDQAAASREATAAWWRRRRLGELRLVTVPGDAESMLQPPHVAELAAVLARIAQPIEPVP